MQSSELNGQEVWHLRGYKQLRTCSLLSAGNDPHDIV